MSSCQKEYSKEIPAVDSTGNSIPQDSLATFSLVPAGANCSDAAVTGDFIAGTAIAGTSTVSFTVNVTQTGYWTLTTSVVNGILFAGTGKFTTTGTQSISLLANGTPKTAGISQFDLNVNGNSCGFPVTVLPAGSTSGNTGDYYYKATIGGTAFEQHVTDDNNYEAGSGLDGTDIVSFSATINPSDNPYPQGKTAMWVEKGAMEHYLSATDADFKNFFPVGDQPYAPPSSGFFDKGNGVIVGWTDGSGQEWTTQGGTGDQTGSVFKILSVKDAYDLRGIYYIEVKMQFNCNLYNTTTGEKKTLTNGEMVAFFGKI